MSNWNGLDFFIFLIFFLNMIVGMSRGASKEIISMMCLSVALIFAIKFTMPVAAWLNTSPLIDSVVSNPYIRNFTNAIGVQPVTTDWLGGAAYSMSFLICFVGIFCITEAALTYTGFVEAFTFPWAVWSRKVGGALGCTRGYVLTLILISVLNHLLGSNALAGSWFVNLFQSSVTKMETIVAGQQVEQYQKIYENKNLYTPQDIFRTVQPPVVQAPPGGGAGSEAPSSGASTVPPGNSQPYPAGQ